MKHLVRSFLLVLLLAASFAHSLDAQASKAKNQKESIALNQFCPVAYVGMGKAVKGNSEYSSTYKGKTYYSSSADAKKMFDADPEKYLPQYDGYCATAMAMGRRIESDPEIFSVYQGEVYLFSNKEAKAGFDKDPEATIVTADKQFASLAKKKN
jgi:YHS domain-containing protein